MPVPAPNQWSLHLVFTGMIASMTYVFGLSGGNFTLLLIAQGLFVFWVALIIATTHPLVVLNKGALVSIAVLAIVLASNILTNINNYQEADRGVSYAIAHGIGVFMFALAVVWASRNLQLSRILQCLAWLLLPLVVIALFFGFSQKSGGRPMLFGLQPNWWGEVAFGFVLCSLVVRHRTIHLLFILLGLVLMYVVQSRGAMLGAVVGIGAFWAVKYRPFGKKALRKLAVVGIFAILALLIVFASGLWVSIAEFLVSKVLFLDDPYRGVDSNLTGRIEGYLQAIAIFVENPFFGQGFDTLYEVHNGFLRWAGEGGIILLGLMVYLIFSALVRAWRYRNDWAFAALLAIIVYFLTYPRALNLNLVGVLFFLALFCRGSLVAQSDSRHVVVVPDRNKRLAGRQTPHFFRDSTDDDK